MFSFPYLVLDNEGLLGGDESRLGEETLDLGDLLGIQLLIKRHTTSSSERDR